MIEFDPIINGVQHVTYHRKPTSTEIKFGYGATHYRDIPIDEVTKKKHGAPFILGPVHVIKKWTVCKDDGLRYYR